MKKIILIATSEGTFDYNRNLDFDSIKNKEVQISLHIEMVFDDASDVVMMAVYTRYAIEKELLLSYRVSLHFKVDGWQEFISDKKDIDIKNTDEVHRMLGISVGYLRGALVLQTRTTKLNGAFLPLINIDELSKEIHITRWKERK